MTWIITKDHIADATWKAPSCMNAVGMTGPRDGTDAEVQALKEGQGEPFRMYDGDDELYYEGRWLENDHNDELEPLDNFGFPNAGCAYIMTKHPKTGKWEMV